MSNTEIKMNKEIVLLCVALINAGCGTKFYNILSDVRQLLEWLEGG